MIEYKQVVDLALIPVKIAFMHNIRKKWNQPFELDNWHAACAGAITTSASATVKGITSVTFYASPSASANSASASATTSASTQ